MRTTRRRSASEGKRRGRKRKDFVDRRLSEVGTVYYQSEKAYMLEEANKYEGRNDLVNISF